MTDNDKSLLARARQLPPSMWDVADTLASRAESPEARAALRQIARSLYHREEYYCGCD